MIRSFKERRDSEEGFTLIELMVVVLIIGILLAIAVPTFLNAQKNAKTKAATSNLRSALSAVKTVHADKQTYTTTAVAGQPTIDASTLREAEPSLQWLTGASDSAEKISFVGDVDTFAMANKSALGHCFYIIDDLSNTAAAGTRYFKDTATTCSAAASLTAPTIGGTITGGTSTKIAEW